MTSHQIFARNLRHHCERHQSIAAICLATKINRQQFNKYLSGKVLPGALNLRKICRFLAITEEELFRSRETPKVPVQVAESAIASGGETMAQLINLLPFAHEELEFHKPGLSAGYYFCYTPMIDRTDMFVRSLVWVYRKGPQLHFVRVTSIHGRLGKSPVRMRGRHSGIIFSNGSEIFMMAFNRYAKGQLTISVLRKPQFVDTGLLTGQTLTRGIDKFVAMRTVLVPIPSKTTVREMLKEVGPYSVTHPSIDMTIRIAFPDKSYL